MSTVPAVLEAARLEGLRVEHVHVLEPDSGLEARLLGAHFQSHRLAEPEA
jgi:hypothetical protein